MEAGRSANEGRITRGRRKQEEKKREEEEKARKDTKRRKTLFQPRKVVGPRDILVNRVLGKVSLGVDQDVKPVVKLEETRGVQAQGESEDAGLNEQGVTVDMQVSEVEHVVKVEVVELPENLEHAVIKTVSVATLGMGGDEIGIELDESVEGSSSHIQNAGESNAPTSEEIENILREENRLLKEENASINARNQTLEERVKELETSVAQLEKSKAEIEVRVTQLENRNKDELEALIDGKLREHGISPQPLSAENLEFSHLQKEVILCKDNKIKVTELFPEVVKIIWEKFGKSLLSSKDFLNARLVCTSWNEGIDKIENGPCHFLHDRRHVVFPMCCLDHTVNLNKTKQELGITTGLLPQTTLTLFDNHYKRMCYFLGSFTESGIKEACKNEVIKLLQKHGSNVQTIIYDLPLDLKTEYYLDSYQTLMDLVVCMPDLEILFWQGYWKFDVVWSNLIADAQSFPNISKLRRLECFHVPVLLLRAVLLANDHITSLSFSLTLTERATIFKDISLSQLKDLQVSCYHPESLPCLLQCNALSLTSLKLSLFCLPDENETVELENAIYKVIQQFQATLLDLHFELDFNRDFSPFLLESLPKLPKLKRLKIEKRNGGYLYNSNLKQFQKLVPSMHALEYLELREDHWCNKDKTSLCLGLKETNAQRYKLMKTEFVSRLWHLLPKLHHVKISCSGIFSGCGLKINCDFVR